MLNGMGHQLASEQAMRRADGQAFDMNMKAMEASMQSAQEGIVNRTVSMIEAKAQGFIKAIKELDVSIGGVTPLGMNKAILAWEGIAPSLSFPPIPFST